MSSKERQRLVSKERALLKYVRGDDLPNHWGYSCMRIFKALIAILPVRVIESTSGHPYVRDIETEVREVALEK